MPIHGDLLGGDFVERMIATGHPYRFDGLTLNGTFYVSTVYGAAPVAGYRISVTVTAQEMTDEMSVEEGPLKLPGGRWYNPWAGLVRSPVAFPRYDAQFVVEGAANGVEIFIANLKSRIGRQGWLFFSGAEEANIADDFDALYKYRWCQAVLLTVGNLKQRTTKLDSPTHRVVRCSWQQVDYLTVGPDYR